MSISSGGEIGIHGKDRRTFGELWAGETRHI